MEMLIRELMMHSAQLTETDIIEIKAQKSKQSCSDEHINIETKVTSETISEQEGYSYIQVSLIPESGNFTFSATVRGKFETKEPIERETFERFLLAQGVRILWSYVREIIYDLTGKMLRNAILLPTLDVVKTLAKAKINGDVENDKNSRIE